MERWDAAHPTVLNKPMHVYGRSTEASKALAELMEGANPPLEWTVVREPLGHFIAGFDQVEYNCGPDQLLCGNFDDGSSETVRGSCRSTHSITPRLTNNMRIYMNSGGGFFPWPHHGGGWTVFAAMSRPASLRNLARGRAVPRP